MATPQQIEAAINKVQDPKSFIKSLLKETLNWQIPDDVENIEDMSYIWPADDLRAEGLEKKVVDGKIWQIQPFITDQKQPWGIFLLEFKNVDAFVSGRGLTGPLRKVLRGLVPKRKGQPDRPAWDRENLLFICTCDYKYYRFAYFKSPKEKGHAEPLTMFGWSPDTPARTVCVFNLPHLVWPAEPENAESWVAHWAKAFDVEAVTKRFYDDYERVFTNLQGVLNLPTPEDKKMFAQVLMNRLMFLRFVERKGWLKLGDSNPKEYLKNLYQARGLNNLSWYRSRLQVLFFEGLAIPNHNKENVIGSIPYLNGGLFTITEWDERAGDIADDVFEPILGEEGILYRYNFTVEESTPLEIEVAVDPEMLGKVFEKLVIARRESGSYYTPRTVVSFMCREALKGYLGGQYAPLVDEHKTDNISVPEARELLSKLDNIKIVDPACGSGAYLLGMLQEIFALTKILDTRAQTGDPHNDYQRKLNVIHNNIYGVDLDEFAVSIARLRLWLSLAVDFEGDEPDPLPNLDYKIEIGDSLTAPDPSGEFPTTFDKLARIKKIEKFDLLKAEYMDPRRRAEHPGLEDEIKQVRQEIFSFTHPDQQIKGFDWRVEFAEVWSQKNGFDIAIANPPYGINVDDFVRNMYFNQKNENEKGQSKDSYGIFITRGLQLLRPGGTMSYIVSDTWRTIKTHRPLRKRLLANTTVLHVLDLPPWIFDATVNTCVLTFSKNAPADNHILTTGDLRAIEKDNWKALDDNLRAISGHGPDIQTTNCARYTYLQNLISTYNNLSFFIGSSTLYNLMGDANAERLADIANIKQGLITGDNEYYIRKRSDARGSYEILDEDLLLNEEQISNLTADEKRDGVNPDNYGGRHFLPYDKGGASDTEGGWLPNYFVPTEYFIDWSRDSVNRLRTATIADVKRRRGKEDEIRNGDEGKIASRFQNVAYCFRRGITFSPTGMYSPSFRLGCGAIFGHKGSTIFFNSGDIEAYLGLLCSFLTRYLLKTYRSHTVETGEEVIGQLVIPSISEGLSQEIRNLVNQIIQQQVSDPEYKHYENKQKEIDSIIYQLYGLNEDDIRDVELWYCRRYPRLAESQGVLAEVKEKYADHLARCQRILEKPPSYWRSNPILQLIAQGESHNLEFKETLEYDVRENRQNRELNKATLKTIAAFLNAEGGTILIGVSDSGEVKGINRDLQYVRGNNRDGFEQKLRSLINDRFDPSPLGFIDIGFEELAEGTVCRVNVRPANTIIHLDNEVYIRDGNGTRQLEGRVLTDWIQQKGN